MSVTLRAHDLLIQSLRIRIARLSRQAFGASSEKIEREIEQLELALEDLQVALAEANEQFDLMDEQKALHDAWKTGVELLSRGQNTTLRQVVVHTAAALRAQGPGMEARSTAAGSPQRLTAPAPPEHVISWGWLSAGMLMGSGATVAVAVIAWLQLAAQ